ncbi:transglutaminaseTgpA domain-containing protein [Nocardioides dongkuii]|uniref:transglutaminase family protein n=1 Tax=Nocardioides dongkuii TaxID=2760089 RepID=UPI0015FE0D47|nr:transglutaminaseTgpA domain-containing protein [Nocardioides dongkuii]
MSRARGSLSAALLLAAVAAATTWVSMLTWRGFALDSAGYLRPLLLLAVVVAGTGALARWWRLPGVVVVGLQLVLGTLVATWSLTGSPLPVGPGYADLVAAFRDAAQSANRYAPPVPARAAPIDPLLVAGGLACLVLVDLLACTIRRVPLAGLPLLAVFTVPVSMLETGIPWWVFALTAAGFLTLLFLHENEQVARWGRPLGEDALLTDPSTFEVRTGSARSSAGAIGGVATALAIVVPLAIPTLDIQLVDLGPGTGSDDEITLRNPMTDMRRDLKRDDDVPLLTVTTDDPDPRYLRISVLNRFSEEEWTSGDRDIPTDQRPDGPMPALEGVDDSVAREEHDYRVEITDAFDSTWLPTQAPVSEIDADGDWRYDEATMDFIAGDEDLDTAGLEYDMTAVELDRRPAAMLAAPSSIGAVAQEFVELPADLPPAVRQLASAVTENAPSRYEKAVVLQDWFREDGGFEYNLDVSLGNGGDDLLAFLTEGPDGREGYCEQFASAMAVMARSLGIPARVAVGFLTPDPVGPDTYEYSSFDLHSWPELFIPGAGWTPFEPTPPDRAASAPSYTDFEVGSGEDPGISTASAEPSNDAAPRPDASKVPTAEPTETAAEQEGDQAGGVPWPAVAGGVGGAALLVLLVAVPRLVRRSRGERRLDGGPEEVWAELRDTATDLGVTWPDRRSPRETRERLVGHLGTPSPEPAERPATGAHVAPGAVRALDRIVAALEQQRYARAAADPGSLRQEAETCVAALQAGATPRARRRAEWWPRSLFRRSAGTSRPTGGRTEAVHGGVVDHVG